MSEPNRERKQLQSDSQVHGNSQKANPYATPEMQLDSRQAARETRPEVGDPIPSTVRFAHLNDAVKVASQQLLQWILVVLSLSLVCFVAIMGLRFATIALLMATVSSLNAINAAPITFSLAGWSIEGVEFLVGTAIYAFVMGGLFRTACTQVRGKPIHVSDLFKTGGVFWHLFLVTLVFSLFPVFVGRVIGGLLGLILPLLPADITPIAGVSVLIIYFIIFLAIAGRLMLTFPLVVDGGQKATAAIRNSWVALRGQTVRAMSFSTLAVILSLLGALLCGVGLVFTFPIYFVAVALVYRDFFLCSSENAVATENGPAAR